VRLGALAEWGEEQSCTSEDALSVRFSPESGHHKSRSSCPPVTHTDVSPPSINALRNVRSPLSAFEVAGSLDDARRFLERCRLFTLAESLGGVESLISLPALMTHASTPLQVRAALGITDRLVRISVGIEDGDDLIADLDAALGGQ
jgi:Cys/Met metabolism PLP-dependent enzyme